MDWDRQEFKVKYKDKDHVVSWSTNDYFKLADFLKISPGKKAKFSDGFTLSIEENDHFKLEVLQRERELNFESIMEKIKSEVKAKSIYTEDTKDGFVKVYTVETGHGAEMGQSGEQRNQSLGAQAEAKQSHKDGIPGQPGKRLPGEEEKNKSSFDQIHHKDKKLENENNELSQSEVIKPCNRERSKRGKHGKNELQKPEDGISGKPEKSGPNEPKENKPGMPEESGPHELKENKPSMPEKSGPHELKENKPGVPEESESHTSGDNKFGKPDKSEPHGPEVRESVIPEESEPHTPEAGMSGKPGKSESHTPGDSKSGKPEKSEPHTPEDGMSGKLGKSEPHTPGDSKSGKPGKSEPHTPEDGISGKPEKSEPHAPGDSKSGKPGKSEPHTPEDGISGKPEKSEPHTPGDSKSGKPGKSEPHTPEDGISGKPEKSEPHTPGDSKSGKPGKSEPHTLEDGMSGKLGKSEPHTPGDSKSGKPGKSDPHTLEDGISGKPEKSEPHAPGDSKSGKPGKSEPHTPEDGISGKPEKSEPHGPEDSESDGLEKSKPLKDKQGQQDNKEQGHLKDEMQSQEEENEKKQDSNQTDKEIPDETDVSEQENQSTDGAGARIRPLSEEKLSEDVIAIEGQDNEQSGQTKLAEANLHEQENEQEDKEARITLPADQLGDMIDNKQPEIDALTDTDHTIETRYESEDTAEAQYTASAQQLSKDTLDEQQEMKSKTTSCTTHDREVTDQKGQTTNSMDYSFRSSDKEPVLHLLKPFHVSYTEEQTKPDSPISSTDSSSQGDTDSSFVVLKDSDVSSEDYEKEVDGETHVSLPKLPDKDNEALSRKPTEKAQSKIADTKQFEAENTYKEEGQSNNKFSSKAQDETNSYRMVKVFGKYILEDKYGNKVTLPKDFKGGPNVAIEKKFIKDETGDLYEIIRAKGKIALKLVKEAKTVQSDDESSDGGTTSDKTDSTENPDKYPDKKKGKDERTQDSRYADKKNRIGENAKQTLTVSQSDLSDEKRKEEKDRYDVDDADCAGDDVAAAAADDDDDDDDEVNVNNNNLDFDVTDDKTNKSSLSSGDEAQSIPSGITQQKTEDKSDSRQPMPPSRNKTDTTEPYEIQFHVRRETDTSPSRITRLLSLNNYLILQYICRNMSLFDISVGRLKKVSHLKLELKDDALYLYIQNVALTFNKGITIAIECLLKDTDHLMINSVPTAGIDNDSFKKMIMKSAMGKKTEIFACAGVNKEMMHCIYPERLKEDAEALFELCINRLKIINITKTYSPMFAEKVQELLVNKYSVVKPIKEEKQSDKVKLLVSGPKEKVEAFSDDVDRCLTEYCVNTISFKDIKFYNDCCEHLDLEQALQELIETESTEDSDVLHFINFKQKTVSLMAKNQPDVDMFTNKVKHLLKEQTIEVPDNLQTPDIYEKFSNKVMALEQNIVISKQGLGKITIVGIQQDVDCVHDSFKKWLREQKDLKMSREQKVMSCDDQIEWKFKNGQRIMLTVNCMANVEKDLTVTMSPAVSRREYTIKEQDGQKKATVYIPKWTEGAKKEKTTLIYNVKLLLAKATTSNCFKIAFHITDEGFTWQFELLFKGILKAVEEFYNETHHKTSKTVVFVCKNKDVWGRCYEICNVFLKDCQEKGKISVYDKDDTSQKSQYEWTPDRLTNVSDMTKYISIKKLFNKSEEDLKRALENHNIRGCKLALSKRLDEAIVICQTAADATKLCKLALYPGCKISIPTQVMTKFQSQIANQHCSINKKKISMIEEELCVRVIERDDITVVIAPTLCQLYCTQEKLSSYLTNKEENVQSEQTVNIEVAKVSSENVYTVLMHSKKELDELSGICKKNILFNGDSIMVEIPVGENIPKGLKDFIDRLNSLTFEVCDLVKKFKDQAEEFCQEITNVEENRWCVYDEKKEYFIIAGENYGKLQEIKHKLNVKQGKIMVTKRGARHTAKAKTEDIPLKTADFKWSRDANNIQMFTTNEGIKVHVYNASIVNLPVDCIVNAANEHLQHGGGVAYVIEKAAGKALTKEGDDYLRSNGSVRAGTCCTTTAGNLPYKRVIHTVGPRWIDYHPHSLDKVEECAQTLHQAIMQSFLEADKNKLKSIALPAISSAIFGVPQEICSYQYAKATIDYSKERSTGHLEEIHFIDINADIISTIQSRFQSFINLGVPPKYDINKFVKSGTTKVPHSRANRKFPSSPKQEFAQGPLPNVFEQSDGNHRVFYCGENNVLHIDSYDIFATRTDANAVVCLIDEYGHDYGRIADQMRNKAKNSNFNFEGKKSVKGEYRYGQVWCNKVYQARFSHAIHVVVPRYHPDFERRKDIMIDGYKNVFKCCQEKKEIHSVVMSHQYKDCTLSTAAFFEAFLEFCQSSTKGKRNQLHVFFTCKEKEKSDIVYNMFHEYAAALDQQPVQNNQLLDTTNIGETINNAKAEDVENCVICMDKKEDPSSLPCGHSFCASCLESALSFKQACPTCLKVVGTITGDQPDGSIRTYYSSYNHCAGYDKCGTITITYSMPSGRQLNNHPNPGQFYKGIIRHAYLPGNRRGNVVCEMLKIAFHRKLVFTIGSSRTTGEEGVITWNDIHHKTNPKPHEKFGYPDESYLDRVTDELAAKGVTEKDIPADVMAKIDRLFRRDT